VNFQSTHTKPKQKISPQNLIKSWDVTDVWAGHQYIIDWQGVLPSQMSRPESLSHRGQSLRPGDGNNYILWRLSPLLLTSWNNPQNYGALNTKAGLQAPIFSSFWGSTRESPDQPRKSTNLNIKVNPPNVVNKHQNKIITKCSSISPFWCLMTTYGFAKT
jgi:hypothetical protein